MFRVIRKEAAWMVPPSQAVWIPSDVDHCVHATQPIALLSLFVDESATTGLPEVCRVVHVPPLVRVGSSARTLARLFVSETGLTFAQWRRQMRLLEAIDRLGKGDAVARVALDLGYESPSAFTAMFRRVLGAPPGNISITWTRPPSRHLVLSAG